MSEKISLDSSGTTYINYPDNDSKAFLVAL